MAELKKAAKKHQLYPAALQKHIPYTQSRWRFGKYYGYQKQNGQSLYPLPGKVIRNIRISVFDPFGYSVNDTINTPDTWLEKAGNRYHVITHKRIIGNLLLFRPGKTVDPLAMSESERILRQTPYVNDAHIFVKDVRGDSVDVTVLVHDKWSLGVSSNLDPTRPNLNVLERNLVGSGQQFEQKAEVNTSSGELKLAGRHNINNIRRTFITSDLYYSTSFDIQQVGFGLNRAFYSPLTKWAGGIGISRTWTYFTPPDTTVPGQLSRYGLDYNQQDLWAGHSIRLGKGKGFFSQSSNLVFSARYFNNTFTEKPGPDIDIQSANRDYTLVPGKCRYIHQAIL